MKPDIFHKRILACLVVMFLAIFNIYDVQIQAQQTITAQVSYDVATGKVTVTGTYLNGAAEELSVTAAKEGTSWDSMQDSMVKDEIAAMDTL